MHQCTKNAQALLQDSLGQEFIESCVLDGELTRCIERQSSDQNIPRKRRKRKPIPIEPDPDIEQQRHQTSGAENLRAQPAPRASDRKDLYESAANERLPNRAPM